MCPFAAASAASRVGYTYTSHNLLHRHCMLFWKSHRSEQYVSTYTFILVTGIYACGGRVSTKHSFSLEGLACGADVGHTCKVRTAQYTISILQRWLINIAQVFASAYLCKGTLVLSIFTPVSNSMSRAHFS